MAINPKISDDAILAYLRHVRNGATASTWPTQIGNKKVTVYENGSFQGVYDDTGISIGYNHGTNHYAVELEGETLCAYLHQGYFYATKYEMMFDTNTHVLTVVLGNRKIEIAP